MTKRTPTTADLDAAIQQLRQDLAALERAKAVLLRTSRANAGASNLVGRPRARSRKSGVDLSEMVLAKAGEPLHIEEIIKRIGEMGTRKVFKKQSLGSTLLKYAKAGRIFVKAAPNTFGLIEQRSE